MQTYMIFILYVLVCFHCVFFTKCWVIWHSDQNCIVFYLGKQICYFPTVPSKCKTAPLCQISTLPPFNPGKKHCIEVCIFLESILSGEEELREVHLSKGHISKVQKMFKICYYTAQHPIPDLKKVLLHLGNSDLMLTCCGKSKICIKLSWINSTICIPCHIIITASQTLTPMDGCSITKRIVFQVTILLSHTNEYAAAAHSAPCLCRIWPGICLLCMSMSQKWKRLWRETSRTSIGGELLLV